MCLEIRSLCVVLFCVMFKTHTSKSVPALFLITLHFIVFARAKYRLPVYLLSAVVTFLWMKYL